MEKVGKDYNDYRIKNNRPQISEAVQHVLDEAHLLGGKKFTGSEEQVKKLDEFVTILCTPDRTQRGYGDKFFYWCARKGRKLPSTDQRKLLNTDVDAGVTAIKNDAKNPERYRNLMTFKSMGGSKSV